jgi:hypothetical protein
MYPAESTTAFPTLFITVPIPGINVVGQELL